VLNQLEGMDLSYEIDIKDAVAAYRTDDGKLRVDQSAQPTTKEGAAWGAMLGGLIGAALLAPLTVGASAAVAATALGTGLFTGGVTGAALGADDADTWKKTYGISDDFVKEVGGMVQPGQSAVFVLARSKNPVALAEKFRGYGGTILRTTLSAESAARFEKLMTPATAAR
jgi:uncharacterized membrane protein